MSTRSWRPPTAAWRRSRATTSRRPSTRPISRSADSGPELSRLVQGGTALAIDARKNLDPLTTLIDQSKPILDTQTDTAGSIQAWASNLATITDQLQTQDTAVAGILEKGPGAADEVRALFDRLQPTLPIVLANLVSIGEVAVTYQPSLEQLLVLLPQGTATTQAIGVAKRNTKQDYEGDYLTLNLNLNLPPPCTTGFLPAQQQRAPSFEDYPDRPAGDVYCRIPQDAPFNVRGARNLPCITVPGKRAPTVKQCESNENYVPLNDGYNWKGDPNATLSGQPDPARAAGLATCRSSSAAGSGAAATSGRRIRPGDRHVRWTGRACVYTGQPGPQCRRGANMADDAAAPDGELSETTAAEPESTAIEEPGDVPRSPDDGRTTLRGRRDRRRRRQRTTTTRTTTRRPSHGCRTCGWRRSPGWCWCWRWAG